MFKNLWCTVFGHSGNYFHMHDNNYCTTCGIDLPNVPFNPPPTPECKPPRQTENKYTTPIEVTFQGAVLLCKEGTESIAVVYDITENSAIIEFELTTKYASAELIGSNTIGFLPTEVSDNIHEEECGLTTVRLSEFGIDWSIFTVSVSKYTVRLALVKQDQINKVSEEL